jgi:hypothetical protein
MLPGISLLLFGAFFLQQDTAAVNPRPHCECQPIVDSAQTGKTSASSGEGAEKPSRKQPPPSQTCCACCSCQSVGSVGTSTNEPNLGLEQKKTDEPGKSKPEGGSYRIKPGQRLYVHVPNFNQSLDSIWVGDQLVDSQTIQLERRDLVSFIVPDSAFNQTNRNPVVRAGPAKDSVDTARLVSSLELAEGRDFRQTRGAAVLAAGLFTLLLPLALSVAMLAHRTTGRATRSTLIAKWLIDNETKSYSLQRIQFYLWTAAGVFTYVYACYGLVVAQGIPQFPQLPQDLVGLLGISGTTSFVAAGIKGLRGAEGAGSCQPKLSDLWTTGDVVAIEKVQLVVWTLIGVTSFMVCIVSLDPMQLSPTSIPDVPKSLLELAGLSGGLYAAGKFVRGPGPVLTLVEMIQKENQPGIYSVTLRGANLSQDAKLYLDEKPLQPSDILNEGGVLQATPSGKSRDSRLANGLQFDLRLEPSTSAVTTGRFSFEIENPDGQRAEKRMIQDPPESTRSESNGPVRYRGMEANES